MESPGLSEIERLRKKVGRLEGLLAVTRAMSRVHVVGELLDMIAT